MAERRNSERFEINFSGTDTIYYYKIDGTSRQALDICITNKTNTIKTATIRVFAPGYETVVTSLTIFPGTKHYRAYAPVVYPNIKSGSPRPVLATVSLTVATLVKRKRIRIGVHRPWTIFICQDVCTDFTWRLNEGLTVRKSNDLSDSHLRFMKLTEKEVWESQNRWNFNQSMEVKWYIENKFPKKIETLFQRERDGHIQISPLFNACLTATMSTEQAIRSLYFARELAERWGIDLSTVEHIEVPTITWGMASIFGGAGIKYFVKGWLAYQAPYTKEQDNIPLYYWEGPDGQRVLTASDKEASIRAHYAQARFLLNEDYAEVVNELHNWWVPHFESIPNYPYDAFILLGSHGDLSLKAPNQVKILVSNIKRYNEEPWEYPKLVNANWKQFFHHIEKFTRVHHVAIPVLRGDHGSSWEEWPVHVAAIFARTRRGVENFITAEKLVALCSRLEPEDYLLNKGKLQIAQERMLQLSEHPWNGSSPQEKTDAVVRKNRWQEELNQKVDSIIKQGLTNIAKNIPTEDEICLMVFNPLVWERTDMVTVAGLNESRVIDRSTKKEVHTQVVLKNGEKFLQFVAEDVPPLGYKVYELLEKKEQKNINGSVSVNRNVIENRFYRIEVDDVTGGLKRVFDKLHHTELVDQKGSYKLNQYVYLSNKREHTPLRAKIAPGMKGPISGELIIEAATIRSHMRTTLILYSDIDRIDIRNEVEKTPSSEPTEVHFFFPFNVPRRKYHYEATAAIIKPGLVTFGGEQLAGSGQAINAARHFVDVSNESYGVILAQLDSYLVQFGHRTTEESPKVPDPSNSTVLSMIMQNHQPEMVANQGGISRFMFRYAIQGHSQGFNAERAIRFGWEMNNPLLTRILPSSRQAGVLPAANCSFLSCDHPNVVVTALKVAEEGLQRGLILRAWEVNGQPSTVLFDVSALGIHSAFKTDLLERDKHSLTVSRGKVFVSIPGRGFTSIRLLKTQSV